MIPEASVLLPDLLVLEDRGLLQRQSGQTAE
jgi:hypothetical protein